MESPSDKIVHLVFLLSSFKEKAFAKSGIFSKILLYIIMFKIDMVVAERIFLRTFIIIYLKNIRFPNPLTMFRHKKTLLF
ncbi:hypothetical protein D0469_04555 [Peribacillus saganii]|uniref:Uncharacterized protein n=1 Tax=Peribacillus saganii TaxID=2303992 RepID=A0A372LSP2_9BACI|nr:hypothetical protein D0469_04555 [Peribacillus saganii]